MTKAVRTTKIVMSKATPQNSSKMNTGGRYSVYSINS